MIGNATKLFSHPDRLEAFWRGLPVVPVTVEIRPTDRCNQKCAYCSRHSHASMSFAELARIFTECAELGVRGFVFSGGGEPLLALPDDLGTVMPCGLITNGSVLKSAAFWRQFTWVRFSVDSFDPALYQKLRGVPFPDDLLRNIRHAQGRTCVGVQMVVTEDTKEHVVEFVEAADDAGAEYVQVRPREDIPNPPWPSDEELSRAEALATDDFGVLVRRDKIGVDMSGPCHAGSFMLTILPDLTCAVCSCTGAQTAVVGSLRKQTLREIVYGQRRSKVLGDLRTELCPPNCKGANINRALSNCGTHAEFL